MVVVPLSKPADEVAAAMTAEADSTNWVGIAAAASLAASGALLVTGNRRAGLVAAAAGTALAMIDQKDTVIHWWNALPGYLAEMQCFLGRVQSAVDDISAHREKLQKIFQQ